jgi:hypothetical protein
VRVFGELVAIALVKTVSVEAGAAGGHAQDGEASLPGPLLYMLAEAKADLAVAVTVFNDEAANEGVRWGLEMMLDGNLDPAHDFFSDTSYEGNLVLGARRQGIDPSSNFGGGALVTELFGEGGYFGRI